ncbi:MAG: hypothetical protein AB7U18_08575, partial [Dehalococcoidia bacterium]
MMLHNQPERKVIEQAMATRHLSVPDEHGFHHWIYADCPDDGGHASPQRTIAANDARGRHFEAIDFRCT